MSLMPEYDGTAGFPQVHVLAFQKVAQQLKMVICSRELNPLCTDLVLENYAAKGFHIKAKTCDWGPMAGFVLEDRRFTKASQDLEKQAKDIGTALENGAQCVPLHLSDERLSKLQSKNVIKAASQPDQSLVVTASPGGQRTGVFKFRLVKTKTVPPGADKPMWGVYYEDGATAELARNRQLFPLAAPAAAGLTPVMGMANPNSDASLGVKAAVAGDYDLWCVFPHSTAKDAGIQDRAMPLRAAINPAASPGIKERAAKAGLIYRNPGEKAAIAGRKEDAHLGNISLGIMKVRSALNAAIKSTGYTGGDVVQHSDYGGNPFGDIDYPLIFFIPGIGAGGSATYELVSNINDLKTQLRQITKQGFNVRLNPQWTVPSF